MTARVLEYAFEELVAFYEAHSRSRSDKSHETETDGKAITQNDNMDPSLSAYVGDVDKLAGEDVLHFQAGAAAAFTARSCTAPMSVIQVQMQTSVGQRITIREAFQTVWNRNGMIGFWTGHGAALARITPASGIKFFVFNYLTKKASHDPGHAGHAFMGGALAGAIAGASSLLCVYPLEVIKTQMVVRAVNIYPAQGPFASPKADAGILDAASKIFAKHGFLGFYRGVPVNFLGIVLLEGTRFACYGMLKSTLKSTSPEGKQLSTGHYALMGWIAGAVAQGVSYPVDVVRRRVIASYVAEAQVADMCKRRSARDVARTMLLHEGLRSFFRGAVINKMKAPLSSAIIFTVYEEWVNFFSLSRDSDSDSDN